MEITYYILCGLILFTSTLSFIDRPHWIFRMFEFAKVHLLFIQIGTFTLGWFLKEYTISFWILQSLLGLLIIINTSILIKYTPLFSILPREPSNEHSQTIKLLSANVYQFNTDYQSFIDLIEETKPDIILTIESNKDWEKALKVIEKQYPNHKKVALENTYGLHLYTSLELKSIKVNYFVADDIPSIEARLMTDDGYVFNFVGVHPPPPSPTEEENSKERDGELMCVAKKVKGYTDPTVVVGDFNTVAWSKVSTLFRKTSELVDPRIGRGLISTFHADYKLFRFPIDQMFHSPNIYVQNFTVLKSFGSDHLPLYSEFIINEKIDIDEDRIETLESDEMEEVEELIKEGKEENGDRDKVATE